MLALVDAGGGGGGIEIEWMPADGEGGGGVGLLVEIHGIVEAFVADVAPRAAEDGLAKSLAEMTGRGRDLHNVCWVVSRRAE